MKDDLISYPVTELPLLPPSPPLPLSNDVLIANTKNKLSDFLQIKENVSCNISINKTMINSKNNKPQLNGKAKRLNHTLVKKARVLLLDLGLEKKF